MPLRDHRMPVSREDHLALLGDLEPAVHRAGCLRKHGPARRSAAPSERTAAAVKEYEPYVPLGGPPDQPLLYVEQAQGGTNHAKFLGRVGIAEHDLEPSARVGQPSCDRLDPDHLVQDLNGMGEVVAALEQRYHVEYRRPSLAGPVRQLVHGGNIAAEVVKLTTYRWQASMPCSR